MTAHMVRLKRPAKGHQKKAKRQQAAVVRIAASFSPADFARLKAIAAARKVPVAKVIREVVVAYLRAAKQGAD